MVQTFLVITGVQFFLIDLNTVRRVKVNANLKKFQHKIFSDKKKLTLNMGESRVAEPIAHSASLPNILDIFNTRLGMWTLFLSTLTNLY